MYHDVLMIVARAGLVYRRWLQRGKRECSMKPSTGATILFLIRSSDGQTLSNCRSTSLKVQLTYFSTRPYDIPIGRRGGHLHPVGMECQHPVLRL